MVNQTNTGYFVGEANNPPLVTPLSGQASGTAASNINPGTALTRPARPPWDRHSPTTISCLGRMQTWNVNVEREFGGTGVMVGYFGSHGDRQRIPINLNQFTTAGGIARPYPKLSASSPILPGTQLGNITETTSLGWSDYKGLWLTANRRLSKGLQLSGSYTLSKSTDTNSYDGTLTAQDNTNLAGSVGPSDFDVRHRVSVNASYDLPFSGNRWKDGWQVVVVEQAQTGNPLNVVTNITTITGTATVRPDLIGALPAITPTPVLGSGDGRSHQLHLVRRKHRLRSARRRLVHVVVGVRAAVQRGRRRALRQHAEERDLRTGIRRHRLLADQERDPEGQRADPAAGRGLQPVQPGESWPTRTDGDGRQHVVRPDQQHTVPDRRLGIGEADSVRRENHVLNRTDGQVGQIGQVGRVDRVGRIGLAGRIGRVGSRRSGRSGRSGRSVGPVGRDKLARMRRLLRVVIPACLAICVC